MKLVFVEEDSDQVSQLWSDARDLVTCRLTYVEARSGIARASRDRRLRPIERARSLEELQRLWSELEAIELDEELSFEAGDAADGYGLRAGDAIQLAAALRVADETLVFASWDSELRDAAASAGLAVAP